MTRASGYRWFRLFGVGIILSTGIVATTISQANAVDFTCPARTVCVFPNDDYTGNYAAWHNMPAQLATDLYNGIWTRFSDVDIKPNPGSLHDNSNSCVWVLDEQENDAQPIEPNTEFVADHNFGWFFIQFGVSTCGSVAPPNPPQE